MNTLIKILVNKVTYKAAKAIVTFLVSGLIAGKLKESGVTIEPLALQAAIIGLIESIRTTIKSKFKVGWL